MAIPILIAVSTLLAATLHITTPISGSVDALYLPAVVQVGSTISITTVDDELNRDGDCALREAIEAANQDRAVDACPPGTGADLVLVPAGTYRLTLVGSDENENRTGDLDLASALTLRGAGAEATVIDGVDSDRIFDIQSAGHVRIEQVAIVNGLGLCVPSSQIVGSFTPCGGGGILNGGWLHLEHVLVRANRTPPGGAYDIAYCRDANGGGGICNLATGKLAMVATQIDENVTGDGGSGCWKGGGGGDGGGILNWGAMTIVSSTIDANRAGTGYPSRPGGSGGGIANAGMLEVISSTVSSNRSGSGLTQPSVGKFGGAGNGGGIRTLSSGVLTVTASSIYSNATGVDDPGVEGGWGGGIAGMVALFNSTVSGNHAAENGGGGITGNGSVIVASTIASNTAATTGGGLYIYPGVPYTLGIQVRNVLLAGNGAAVDGPDCYGPLYSFGYNLVEDATGCTLEADVTGNHLGQAAVLLPFGDWGGSTWTHALGIASAARDAGSCTDMAAAPITTDQRNVSRPQGPACDIGAVEQATP